jgi:hypothetical protein
MWLITMFAVVEAIRHLGDDESAARAYDMLAPFAELPLIGSLGIVCFGSTHRSLAWCALTYGDRDRGIGHFRRAIDHDIGIGNLPMLAMTRAELAHTIALEDARSAGTLYQQAIDSGSRFDMVRWIEIWQDEQRSLLERRARPLPARCCRQGNVWHLEVGSAHVLVPHCIGMTMICDLVASPYADIPVAGLTGAPHTATRQKVLDARARDELRRRVNELQRRIDLADDHGDTALSQQLCEELDRIKVELSRNLGLGGGSREFATPTERARTSVQKAIRRALDSIAEQAPELASELRRSIHTGTYCRFQPVEGLPSNWVTSR